jgi:hypothetical protein
VYLRTKLLLFIGLFLTYGYFYQSGGHNENSRLDLTRAIVEYGITSIDTYANNTADGIHHGEHFYSGKAPGSSILSIPAWYIFSKIAPQFTTTENQSLTFTCFFTIWFSLGFLSALSGTALYEILRRLTSHYLALGVTLTYGLSTIVFPFSTLYFGHQFVGALFILSFGILFFAKEKIAKKTRNTEGTELREERGVLSFNDLCYLFLSGFCLSFTLVTEYPSALVIPFFCLYALSVLKISKGLFAVILGCLLSAAILITYNIISFNDPFFIPYSTFATDPNSVFQRHKVGLFGITLPSIESTILITFSYVRGIFICNPVLLFFFPSLFLFFKKGAHLPERLLCLFVCIGYFLVNAGYGAELTYAGGGTSIGARHLIPAIPFALILIACFLKRYPLTQPLFLLLSTVSACIMIASTSVEPRFPYDYDNPLIDFVLPNYLDGRLSTTTSSIFERFNPPHHALAFNFGALLGLPSSIQLFPLLVFWIVLFYFLFRDGTSTQSRLLKVSKYLSLTLVLGFIIAPVINAKYQEQLHLSGKGFITTYYQGALWKKCDPLFSKMTFTTNTLISKIELTPSFQHSQISAPFSAHWHGKFTTEHMDRYTFKASSDDGACIYIDGKIFIDDWGEHAISKKTSIINLEKGQHALDVIYQNLLGSGELSILWGSDPKALSEMRNEHY